MPSLLAMSRKSMPVCTSLEALLYVSRTRCMFHFADEAELFSSFCARPTCLTFNTLPACGRQASETQDSLQARQAHLAHCSATSAHCQHRAHWQCRSATVLLAFVCMPSNDMSTVLSQHAGMLLCSLCRTSTAIYATPKGV